MSKRVFKVLIVDDAFFIRNLIKRAITTKPDDLDYTFEVVGEAKNGKEGIVEYFKLKPDFITLDLNMPDINGVEVVKQIKSKDPNVKIIVISGKEDEKLKNEIMELGVWHYVGKPFQNAFLWEKMDKIAELIIENEKNLPSSRSEKELYTEVVREEVTNENKSSSENIVIISDEEDNIFAPKDNLQVPKIEKDPVSKEVSENTPMDTTVTFSTDLEFDIDKELPQQGSQVITVKDSLIIEFPEDNETSIEESSKKETVEELIIGDATCDNKNEDIEKNKLINKEEELTISQTTPDNNMSDNNDEITLIEQDMSSYDIKKPILNNKISENVNNLLEATIGSNEGNTPNKASILRPQTGIEPLTSPETEYKENNHKYNTVNSNNRETSTHVENKKGEVSITPPRSKILQQIYSDTPEFELVNSREEVETKTIGEENKSKKKGLFSSIKNLFNKK